MSIESPTRELAKAGEVERRELTKVVESVVLNGDISRLTPQERTQHYLRICERLRLDPSTQPLLPLKLNGKEILYPTKGATDQLAATWGVDRRMVERPSIIDTGAGKIIVAVCEAHWRGRTDTSTGAVPLPSGGGEVLCNAFLKAESKSKRRATLSILGLGMLAEDEVESIPASAKALGAPVGAALPASVEEREPGSDDDKDALADWQQAIRDQLSSAETAEAIAAVYAEVQDAEHRPWAHDACVSHAKAHNCVTKVRELLRADEDSRRHRTAEDGLLDALAKCERGADVVATWLDRKGAVQTLPKPRQKWAWGETVKAWESCGGAGGEVGLKAALQSPPDGTDGTDAPKRGARKPAAASAEGSGESAASNDTQPNARAANDGATMSLAAWEARLAAKGTRPEIVNSYLAHERELPEGAYALVVARWQKLGGWAHESDAARSLKAAIEYEQTRRRQKALEAPQPRLSLVQKVA